MSNNIGNSQEPIERSHLQISSGRNASLSRNRSHVLGSLERILEKIGVGKYNIIAYSIVAIGILYDGSQIVGIAILNYVFQNAYWFVSSDEIGMLGSLLFVGVFIGSFLSGLISDRYGRKKPFIIFLFIGFVLGILAATSPSFNYLVAAIACYGLIFGVLNPLVTAIISEISPKNFRGKAYSAYGCISFTTGEVIAVFIAQQCKVEEKGSESWRYLLIWNQIPGIIAACLGIFLLYETPRYALSVSYEKAIGILKHMFQVNHKKQLQITETEEGDLREWASVQQEKMRDSSFKSLFKGRNLRVTLCLWALWFGCNFLFYGIVYTLPMTINAQKDASATAQYKILYTSALSEFPSHLVAYYIIEHPDLGRKRTIIMFLLVSCVGSFGVYFYKHIQIVFLVITKFSSTLVFDVLAPFTAESYNTSCRVKGFGAASSIARLSGVLMPWIVLRALAIDNDFPFVVFGGFALISAVVCMFIKNDTTGRPLDLHDSDEEEQKLSPPKFREESRNGDEEQQLLNQAEENERLIIDE